MIHAGLKVAEVLHSQAAHTFLNEGKFTGLGIDNFAAEDPGPERPLCMGRRQAHACVS